MALTLLLRYWRECSIAVLLAFAVLMFQRHEANVRTAATLAEQVRVMDSTLKATKPAALAQGQTIVYDTQTVMRLLRKVDTLMLLQHDTAYFEPEVIHDSAAVPLPTGDTLSARVVRDSLIPACTRLAHDCGAYQAMAERRFADYEKRLAAQVPISSQSSSARRSGARTLVFTAIGGAALYEGGKYLLEHYLVKH